MPIHVRKEIRDVMKIRAPSDASDAVNAKLKTAHAAVAYMLHGTYPWIGHIHGNRYLFMVVFHPSHGQITTNRMYLPMDIGDIHGFSTKSMKKQPNIDTVASHFLILFPHQSTPVEAIQTTPAASHIDVMIVRYRRPLFLLIW